MAMVVKNNMAAVSTLNTLNRNSGALQKSLAKVSSGMKINSAQDDASGYAISERMRVQIRALDQANQNTQNGSSMMKTAEGAVSSTIEILKTLKEKAINAATDTNTDEDRKTIQKEVNQFIDQIDDNALVTFNGKYLVEGSKVQAGSATVTAMTNQKLGEGVTGTDTLTTLTNRKGEDLNIASTDYVTASFVKDGKTYSTSYQVKATTLDDIFDTLNKEFKAKNTSATTDVFGPSTTDFDSSTAVTWAKDKIDTALGDGTLTTAALEGYITGATTLDDTDGVQQALAILGKYGADSLQSDVDTASSTLTTAITSALDAVTSTKVTGISIYKNPSAGSPTEITDASLELKLGTTAGSLGYDTTTKEASATIVAGSFTVDYTLGAAGSTTDTSVGALDDTSAAAKAIVSAALSAAQTATNSDMTVANITADTISDYVSDIKVTGEMAADVATVSGDPYGWTDTQTVPAVQTATTEMTSAAGDLSNAILIKAAAEKLYADDAAADGDVLAAAEEESTKGDGFVTSSVNIGTNAAGDTVTTADGSVGLTVRANDSGLAGQIAGLTISISNSEGQVRKTINEYMNGFTTTIFASNKSDDLSLKLQVGANANQSISVGLQDMRAEALGLKGSDGSVIDLTTQSRANAAISAFDNAIAKALDQQTTIGAVEARLEYTASNLTTSAENTQAAESAIRDADMAKEMTNYTKNNVLLQAAQSMLAQANQNASAVLSLLQ